MSNTTPITIPEMLKIGGLTYTVEQTDNLALGKDNVAAEINYRDLTIKVGNNAPDRKNSSFIHEMIHAIYDHLGYTEHDEKAVDELANALYMVIKDNPVVFKDIE